MIQICVFLPRCRQILEIHLLTNTQLLIYTSYSRTLQPEGPYQSHIAARSLFSIINADSYNAGGVQFVSKSSCVLLHNIGRKEISCCSWCEN